MPSYLKIRWNMIKLINWCDSISDHVIEDSGFLLHVVCKCLALSWAFQLEIILPNFTMLVPWFNFLSLNADFGNGPIVETIFALAIIILGFLEPRTVWTVGMTLTILGRYFRDWLIWIWRCYNTLVNIPEYPRCRGPWQTCDRNASKHPRWHAIMSAQNTQAQISTFPQAVLANVCSSLHSYLKREAAQFGLSDCRLPLACFRGKNARVRSISWWKHPTIGRLPLHLPALHHLFDLRTSDTNSFQKKNIMQLMVAGD